MTSLNTFANLQTNFRPTEKPIKLTNNSANCQAQIQNHFWINNQLFWTYHCACCQTYQFEKGQAGGQSV